MNEIIYYGDGQTKDFVFDFPFFLASDVHVKLNGSIMNSGYQVTGVKSTEPADIPYSGGTVTFATAPKSSDKIELFRKIGLERVIDYQPTKKIDPQALNQDFSFLLEALKDFDSAVTTFSNKYAEIIESESYESFSEKLDNINQKLTALGGVDNIGKKSDITALQNATSFTGTGKDNVISWLMLTGISIDLNFLGTSAATYSYIPDRHGVLSLIFVPNASSDISVLAPDGKTLYIKKLSTGMRDTVLIPVHKGLEISVKVPNLSEINYQRLFFFKGA